MPLLRPYGGKTIPPSEGGGGAAARRGAPTSGVPPIVISPNVSWKPSPLRTAVPMRTCSIEPSGRLTAIVTGRPELIRHECHSSVPAVNGGLDPGGPGPGPALDLTTRARRRLARFRVACPLHC